jgi:cardiolipin synthase
MMKETSWEFYTSNPAAWEAMIDTCQNARSSIDFEIFIFTPDAIGERFIDICAKKAAEGVKVRFLWDAAGSFTFFGSSVIQDLRKKGIELVFFKTLLPSIFTIHDYRSWYFRDHRRTLVIDGKIGFTGSTCIEERMRSWRDTVVRLEGPVVRDMQWAFEQMWARAHGKRVAKRPEELKHDYTFEYLGNTPVPKTRHLYRRLIDAIRGAEKRLWIATPYFVPTHRLIRVIRLAAHRGVDVRIMLPRASDFPTVDLGARTYFHQLLKAGVRIYLYGGSMLHTKSVVIDDDWSTVGTLNFDHISLLYNFEANIVSNHPRFTNDLSQQFELDLEKCTEITLDEWRRRFFVEKIATFFVKFIRIFL